jgi:hypothetical protein
LEGSTSLSTKIKRDHRSLRRRDLTYIRERVIRIAQTNGAINIDLTFPASYQVEIVPDFPGYPIPNLFYFPPRGTGGSEGVLLRIVLENADVWMGCFSPFTRTPTLLAAPQADWLFVIPDNTGYAVNTSQPSEWSCVRSWPVTGVQTVKDHGMILFADDTTITAYGRKGVIWSSERLCWDDLKIIGVDGDQIIGCGFDPTNSSEGRFILDVLTGVICESDFPLFR